MKTTLFDEAAKFAIEAHEGALRKGSTLPYIVHPFEAAAIVAGLTEDQELMAAALLHDVVEDTRVKLEEIRERFGDRVAYLVEMESVMPGEVYGFTEDVKAKSWRERKQTAITRIAQADMDTKIVALGDKLSNLRAIHRDYELLGEEIWQRFRTHDPADHKWYYTGLADSLKELSNTAAYEEYMWLLHETFDFV